MSWGDTGRALWAVAADRGKMRAAALAAAADISRTPPPDPASQVAARDAWRAAMDREVATAFPGQAGRDRAEALLAALDARATRTGQPSD